MSAILFAYIFSIYGNEYGCKMIKKIDILGIQLDNYTVREAIMRVEAWYDNNVLNVIEMVSMQMLTESETDPVLKEVISSLDLAVIGEKGILQAAGVDTMQRIRETEENDFSDEFLKRVERNRKSVFVIGETQEAVDELIQELSEEYPKLVLAGAAATEKCVGDLEGVINELNAATPAVIISIIPSPKQEHFLVEHRDKINANLWYGIGGFEVHRKRSKIKGFFFNLIQRIRLKNSIEKYES